MVLPLIKVGILVIKQVTKPVANHIKSYAANHPVFRQWCIAAGRLYNSQEIRITMRLRGHTIREVKFLEEGKAVNLGADLLADTFVFGVGLAIVLFEFDRSSKKEAAKNARMQERLKNMTEQLAVLRADIVELMKHGEYDKTVTRERQLAVSAEATARQQQAAAQAPSLTQRVLSWLPLSRSDS